MGMIVFVIRSFNVYCTSLQPNRYGDPTRERGMVFFNVKGLELNAAPLIIVLVAPSDKP